MKVIEGTLLVYGFGLIGFFGLSLLAFMGSPIAAAMLWVDGIMITSALVVGFIGLAVYYFRHDLTQKGNNPSLKI